METTKKTTSILERVVEVIDRASLEKKLVSGKNLRVKLGADPTAPDLHLGHALVLRILRAFQNAGHKAVFIIGDYTAAIGDPSGKIKTRPSLSDAEIKKNAKTYFEQVGKIIDLKKAEIHYNSEWFSEMALAEFIKIVAHFSTNRILDRVDFRKRMDTGEEVAHHETLYQIMQAYDSVAVRSDVELGGMDQKLNLLAGRELQKKMNLPEQDIVLLPLLVGLDGKQKMSKSLGNYIAIEDSAEEMIGKVMSLPDALILRYAEYAAFVSHDEFAALKKRLDSGENPRDSKLEIAERIAALYHGALKARDAAKQFISLFSKKDFSAVPEKKLAGKEYALLDFLVHEGLVASRSEARRLVRQSAVEINRSVLRDEKKSVLFSAGDIVKIGKKTIFRIV